MDYRRRRRVTELQNQKVSKPKLCIITSGTENGRHVANILTRRGIPFDLLTVSYPRQKLKGTTVVEKCKIYLRDTLANIEILRKVKQKNLQPFIKKPKFVGRCNGKRMTKELNRIAPDYVILMGGGILKAETINIAKQGVLNAHPGLLPNIRGQDAIIHSVLQNIPVGITLHFIDPGIDTGDIIERYMVPIEKGDTYQNIKFRSDTLSNAIIVRFVEKIYQNGEPIRLKQKEKFPLCRFSTQEERALAFKQILDGKALKLYLNFGGKKFNALDGKELLGDFNI